MPNVKPNTPAIAGVSLQSPFFLAPVAGYSDAAFRSVCYEAGAALCYTEMVSSEALVRNHPKTKLLLERSPAETSYAIQLFGSKPEVLARAAGMAAVWKPLIIDLNCGCPVPKIVKAGSGSALMKDPELVRAIVSAMRNASDIPVTVKIRKGWDESSVNYIETAEAAVSGGAAAVTLHGRTRAQGYAGKADWEAIRLLASRLDVPVFGSGDVYDAKSALRMLDETGCEGVMIARGAMGDPFVFSRAKALWEGKPAPAFTNADVARVARTHLERAIFFFGEKTACIEFRKQFCAYSKGLPGGAPLRERAVRCSTMEEFDAVLKDLERGMPDPPTVPGTGPDTLAVFP